MPPTLPHALQHLDDIAALAKGRKLAVFLDYDGTLTPMAPKPEMAVLAPDMRAAVSQLAKACTVGVISGRQLDNVMAMMDLPGIPYAGDHGFRMLLANGREIDLPEAEPFREAVHKLADELDAALGQIPGSLVERKDYSLAAHWRNVAENRVEDFHHIMAGVQAGYPRLVFKTGKMIYDVKPAFDWHKGMAILKFLEVLGLDGQDALPIYVGDDTTDEDGFAALRQRGNGLGILVADKPKDSAATYALRNVDEVREFLQKLQGICGG